MMNKNATLKSILKNKEISLINNLYCNLPNDTISEKIYKLRKRNGLSREELAHKAKFGKSSIRSWERGVKTPNKISIQKICTVFDLDIAYFE